MLRLPDLCLLSCSNSTVVFERCTSSRHPRPLVIPKSLPKTPTTGNHGPNDVTRSAFAKGDWPSGCREESGALSREMYR
jgi:hypothetical protein